MLRTTLSKIKKAWALALASRGRGDVRAYPSKFHKLSIAVLKADKYPDSEKDKQEQCEKCKQLIEYIFGPAKSLEDIPNAIKTKSDVTIPTYAYTQCKIDKDEALIKVITSEQEEKLTQKVEVIDETSLVEAEKKKIDGYNAAPKALGHIAEIGIIDENNRLIYENAHGKPKKEVKEVNIDMREKIDALVRKIEAAQLKKLGIAVDNREDDSKSPILNFATDDSAQNRKQDGTTANEQNSFDAIAKRCLESPSGRIDEHLLKEMKKYGVPQGSAESSMVQIGVIKKRKPVEKTEFEVESRSENTPPDEPKPFGTYYNPQYYKTDDALTAERTEFFREDKEIKFDDATKNQEQTQFIDDEPRPAFNPLVPIIDPYDKKSLIFEKDTSEYPTLTYFESNDEKAAREYAEKMGLNNEQPFQIPSNLYYPGYGTSGQENSQQQFYQNVDHTPHYVEESRKESKASNQEIDSGLYDKKTVIPEGSETDKPTNPEPSQQNNDSDKTGQPEQLFSQGSHPYNHLHHNMYLYGETEHVNHEPKKYMQTEAISSEPETKKQETAPEEGKQVANDTLTVTHASSIEPTKESVKAQSNHEAPETKPTETAILNAKSPEEPVGNLGRNRDPVNVNQTTVEQAATTASICSLPKLKEETLPTETAMLNAKPPEEPVDNLVNKRDPLKENHTKLEQAATAASIFSLPKLKDLPETETNAPKEDQDFVEPKPMGNPLNEPEKPEFEELPKLCPEGEVVPLSELLRRVRLRNRMEYCRVKQKVLETIEGKCGKKKPQCPPAAPKCIPCPPPCSPPQPPPCPRPCKQACPNPCPPTTPTCPPPTPTCPSPCHKFSLVYLGIAIRNINIITLLLNANTKPCRTFVVPNTKYYSVILLKEIEPNVINRLQTFGDSIISRYCIQFGTLTKNLDTFARDFEPWVPIPCWPIPKKEEKRPLVCPKEGCKATPPKLGPPCQNKLNPCLNFPKRASFSLIDLLNTAKFAS